MSDLKERFLEKVEKRDGKWHWKASVNSDGYPKMKDGEKLRLASHISLELAGRAAPEKGKVVLHKNNDPSDVNPANLAVSTQKANLKQMRDEGRDRPRGVDQEPDVKTSHISSYLPDRQRREDLVEFAKNRRSKTPKVREFQRLVDEDLAKVAFASFAEELHRILAKT